MATIAELLLARGRSEADAIRQRGDSSAQMWTNLGGLAANALTSYAQQKEQEPIRKQNERITALKVEEAEAEAQARRAAQESDSRFSSELSKWDGDPEKLMRSAITVYGPSGAERAEKIARGFQALTDISNKRVSDAKKSAGDLAIGVKALPADIQPTIWPKIREAVIAGGMADEASVPVDPTPEYLDGVIAWATGQQPAAPKTREVKVTNPDGTETIQIVEDKPGFTATSTPPPKMQRVVTRGPGGRPVVKMVPETELAAGGVEEYREPDKALKDGLVQIMGPNGTPVWVRESEAVGKPAAQAARAVTGAERGVLAFYNRAKEAVETLTSGDPGQSLEERMAKAGLASQGQLQYAPNMLQTKDQQAYRQAQRAFTEARLRKESGAAIPTAEYENDAKTYFAQPGDDAATIAQKKASRQTVLEGLKFASGKAYEEYYGEPNVSPARGGGSDAGRIYYDENGNPK